MFRFSIREILLVTILVAVICTWRIDRERIRSRYAEEIFRSDNANLLLSDDLTAREALLDQHVPGWRTDF